MNNVNFLPWVGNRYKEGIGPQKYKVMVLGESHYCTLLANGDCPSCSLENCISYGYSEEEWKGQTIEVVDGLINNYTGTGEQQYQQTSLCFERAFCGRPLSDDERKDFWNHLLFYNYIQKSLPKENNKRTTFNDNDLISADSAFREVLEEYLPDRIIIWGVRLYNAIPNWDGELSTIQNNDGESTNVWSFHIKGKEIKAMMVHHPSTPSGKRRSYWHSFYEKFIFER